MTTHHSDPVEPGQDLPAEVLAELLAAVRDVLDLDGTFGKTVPERAGELDAQTYPEAVDAQALARLLRAGDRAGLVPWGQRPDAG